AAPRPGGRPAGAAAEVPAAAPASGKTPSATPSFLDVLSLSGRTPSSPSAARRGAVLGSSVGPSTPRSGSAPGAGRAEADGPDFPRRIDVPGGVPVYLYTDDIDEGTREQLMNLARSRMPVGYVSAMPDVHLGKGATIGSVFASRDYVCPNAVGVDIGCGMCAVPIEGPLLRRDLSEKQLLSIQRGLRATIPTGFESHGRSTREMEDAVRELVSEHRPTSWLRQTLAAKHTRQLGTLGGGNHFVELVYDEADRVWMMLHSGSRNIGNVTAQHYDQVAARQCGGKPEALAYLEIKSKEGKDYLTDMTFCQSYARQNRRFMMEAFAHVLKRETGRSTSWSKMVNIHHNYCECESCRHRDEKTGAEIEEKLWVTRKGATSARKGQLGIIPGSMGTGSYIVRGKGEAESWQSCSHGAGRSMSRAKAFRSVSNKQFFDHMKAHGIVWDSRYAEKVKDEAPMAYKDLNEVMHNQRSLVEIVHHLRPLINMKGF
ncbi:unnamed protein product, partial [Prorocentrum cordatum]